MGGEAQSFSLNEKKERKEKKRKEEKKEKKRKEKKKIKQTDMGFVPPSMMY